MYYTKSEKANYYDCDAGNLLKISAAMRYMQQTSSEQLETLDMSPVKLYQENMVFLLSKMCIKIHRMPLVAEDLLIGTAPTETRGAKFVREFVIDSTGGERLLSAISLWVLVQPENRKILKPSSFPYSIPFQPTIINGAIEDMRFPKLLTTGRQFKTDVEVRYSHIDTNGHVNNSIYADFVCDALPYEKIIANGLDTLVISFQNEAKHGDSLNITTNALADKEYYISGLQDGKACFEALAILK